MGNMSIKTLSTGKYKNYNGSLTLEAAIVIPVMLFLLTGMIILSFIIYQSTLLKRIASEAAQQGAEIWTDSRKSIANGAWDASARPDSVYYRLTEDSLFSSCYYKEDIDLYNNQAYNNSANHNLTYNKGVGDFSIPDKNTLANLQSRKISQIRKLVYSGLVGGILKPVYTSLTIQYENYFIHRSITVIITQEIKIPFGGIKMLFDGSDTVRLTGTSSAAVVEPAEYIRNVDFILEYAKKITEANGFGKFLSNIKARITAAR